MTGADFQRFRELMGAKMALEEPLSERQMAVLFGCSRYRIRVWNKRGAPLYIAYACQAIAHGMTPWGNNQKTIPENEKEFTG